jgi:hypothetical protein
MFALAQESAAEPLVSLTVINKPLGDALASISRNTGYQLYVNEPWQEYPVSAAINEQPLEKGLKRLLNALNHTILWKADKSIKIIVYGEIAPDNYGSAISFSAPPQAVPDEPDTITEDDADHSDEPEPASPSDGEGEAVAQEQEEDASESNEME